MTDPKTTPAQPSNPANPSRTPAGDHPRVNTPTPPDPVPSPKPAIVDHPRESGAKTPQR